MKNLRDDIKKVAEIFTERALQIAPRLELESFEVIECDEQEVLSINARTRGGTAINYNVAASLQSLANQLSKESAVRIEVLFGNQRLISESAEPLEDSHDSNDEEESCQQAELKIIGECWSEMETQKAQGNLRKARQAALRALTSAEKLPSDDRRQGLVLEALIDILYRNHEYELCAPVLVRLLEMYRRCLGRNHIDTATMEHNAALFYQTWGKYDQSRYYYERSLKSLAKSLGPDHPRVEEIRSNLSDLKTTMDERKGEEDVKPRRLPRRKRVMKPSSEHAAITKATLKETHQRQALNIFDDDQPDY